MEYWSTEGLEYWSIGVLEYWKNPNMLLFSFIPIRSIAILDNQKVNPVSSITLPFETLHKFEKSILQLIRQNIQSFKLFFGYLLCFSIAAKP